MAWPAALWGKGQGEVVWAAPSSLAQHRGPLWPPDPTLTLTGAGQAYLGWTQVTCGRHPYVPCPCRSEGLGEAAHHLGPGPPW